MVIRPNAAASPTAAMAFPPRFIPIGDDAEASATSSSSRSIGSTAPGSDAAKGAPSAGPAFKTGWRCRTLLLLHMGTAGAG